MNSKKIIIKEIVVGFSTNSDGVVLSFEGITSISSSFLNSSLGEIIEKYGFDFLKNKIKITNYTSSIAIMIQKYISNFKEPA